MSLRRDSGVQSIDRAVAILKAFTKDDPELGVTDLSRRLDLHKSTVFRILSALEAGGLVAQNKTNDRYHLSLGLLGLAQVASTRSDLRAVARPFLDRLGRTVRETVSLVTLDEYQAITLDQAIPHHHKVVAFPGIGHPMPGHCVAGGKVLLAHYSPEALEPLLYAIEKRSAPTFKPTTRTKLLAELKEVRAQGYALCLEELEPGLHALAAPICNHLNEPVAALEISGPAYRLPEDRLRERASLICQTAEQISAKLGCSQMAPKQNAAA